MAYRRKSQKERRKLIESVIGKVPWDQFEPGIYNYCDRWCEKCKKTKKCFLYYQDIKENIETDNLDKAFIEIKKSFSQTNDLINKIAEFEGLDLSYTAQDEKDFEQIQKATDCHKEPLYLAAQRLTKEIKAWLDSVPPLDIKEYKDAYEKVEWHIYLISVKIYRSLHGKKEAEPDNFKEFSIEDSKKTAWVAYRSTMICRDSFRLMNGYVGDSRILPLAEKCNSLIKQIESVLL